MQSRTPHRRTAIALDEKAQLALAYINECDGNLRQGMLRARGVAKHRNNTAEVDVIAVARWLAGALKQGDVAQAIAAERHFELELGDPLKKRRVPTEAKALLLRWMAVHRVRLGYPDDAEELLDENASHYGECRRCALLDQLVNCHIHAVRGTEGDRRVARDLFAVVRQEAGAERGILSPILFFEQHVLPSLNLG